jgi:hypothetical protein|tara:strand:- start:3784 stop:6696 length:2913 start_codon:yes stop_codon:yes gene_type:complete
MLLNDSKNDILTLRDIRVFLGEDDAQQTVDIDFFGEMRLLKDNRKKLESGWMFDKDFRKALNVYVFQVDDTEMYNLLKKLDTSEIAEFLYKNRGNLTYDVVTAPNLNRTQILKLNKYSNPEGDYIYKVPFKLDRAIKIPKRDNAGTLVYFFLPVIDNGNDNVFYKNVSKKEVLVDGRTPETTKTFNVATNSPEAYTSVQQNHKHTYYIDEFGNGWASSAFSESGEYNAYAQHRHKILDGKIQPAKSVVTGKVHIHGIEGLSTNQLSNRGVINTKNILKSVKESETATNIELTAQQPKITTKSGAVPKGVIAPSARNKTNPLSDKKKDLFSDLLLTKDSNNNNNMIFGLNFNNLVKESSILSRIPNNKALKQLFVSNSETLSLKVYRTRVDATDNAKTDNDEVSKLFLVAESSDDPETKSLISKKIYIDFENNVYVPKSAEDAAKNGQLVGSIAQIQLNNVSSGIRQYAAVDNDASRLVDGKFKYYIEAEVTDPLPETLEGFVKTLKDNMTSVEKYLATANAKNENAALNYDIMGNRFSPSFINLFYQQGLDKDISLAVKKYVTTLSYFQETADISASSVVALLDPKTATLDTIQQVISLHQELITRINQLLGKNNSGRSKKSVMDGARGSYSGDNSSKRKIKVNKNFVESLFSRGLIEQKGVGYEFLDKDTSPEGGIKVLSVSEMRGRFDREKLKANISSTQEVIEVAGKEYNINNIGELTPSKILVATKQSLVSDIKDDAQNLNANLIISQVNDRKQTRKVLLKDKKLQANREVVKWANNNNVVVASLQSEMLDQLEEVDVVDKATELTKKGEDTRELRKQIEKREAQPRATGILTKIYSSYFDTNVTNKGNDFVEKVTQASREELQKLPYHTVALANEISATGPVEYSTAYQNYMNMYKVEVFNGYENTSNGEKSILSPKYEELKDMSQVEGDTLCRLVPYENSELNVRQEESLQLPVLDEHFILRKD